MDFLKNLLASNPELLQDFLRIIEVTAVALITLFSVWATNRNNRKVEIEKLERDDKLSQEKSISEQKQTSAWAVQSTMYKMLGLAQRLNAKLAPDCADTKCVKGAIDEFENTFAQRQDVISEHLPCLPHYATRRVFLFYAEESQLVNALKNDLENNQMESIRERVREGVDKLQYQIQLAKDEFELDVEIPNERLMAQEEVAIDGKENLGDVELEVSDNIGLQDENGEELKPIVQPRHRRLNRRARSKRASSVTRVARYPTCC